MPEIEASADVVEPETETERALYATVSEILGMGGFGVTADLTALGLSSISIMWLSAMIDKTLNRHMTVGDIMQTPTIRALATMLNQSDEKVQTWEKRESYPLSKTQQGILVESLSFEGTTVYNIPYLYKLDDRVDMARLCQALEQVLAAHPFLSMTIGYDDNGEAVAKRSDDVNVRIERLDDLPAIDALVRPFDLTGGEPLCRVALIDGPEGKYLFLDTHHIVSDGESINILFEDINAAYAGGAVETERYTGFEFALDEQPRGLRSISRRHGRGMRANAGALKTRPCHCGRRICTRRIPSRPGGRAVRRMPKPCGPTALSTA